MHVCTRLKGSFLSMMMIPTPNKNKSNLSIMGVFTLNNKGIILEIIGMCILDKRLFWE